MSTILKNVGNFSVRNTSSGNIMLEVKQKDKIDKYVFYSPNEEVIDALYSMVEGESVSIEDARPFKDMQLVEEAEIIKADKKIKYKSKYEKKDKNNTMPSDAQKRTKFERKGFGIQNHSEVSNVRYMALKTAIEYMSKINDKEKDKFLELSFADMVKLFEKYLTTGKFE